MERHLSISATLVPLLLLALFANFSGAFSLRTSSASVGITGCSDGFATVWVENAPASSDVTFSASGSPVASIYLDNSYVTADSYGAASTSMRISANPNDYGSSSALVTAKVCQGSANCDSKSVILYITAAQCGSSANANLVSQNGPYFISALSCGDTKCTNTISKVDYLPQFNPSTIAATISRLDYNRCINYGQRCDYAQVNAGDELVMGFRLNNRAASATMTLKAIYDRENIQVTPDSASIDFTRMDSFDAPIIHIRTFTSTAAGVYPITLQLVKNGVVIAEDREFVQVLTPQGGQIILPKITANGITVSQCSLGSNLPIDAEIDNTGTRTADYAITAKIGASQFYSGKFTVAGGISEQISIPVPSSLLSTGTNTLEITATSDGYSGNGIAKISVVQCNASNAVSAPQVTRQGTSLLFVVTVTNSYGTPLKAVSGELRNVPSDWTQSSDSIDIPAGESRNITINANAPEGEVASPLLVIKSDGKEIAQQQLSQVNAPSGITGFFSRVLPVGNALFIIVIALAVAALFFWAGRTKNAPSTGVVNGHVPAEQDYLERLRKLKSEVGSAG